MTGALQPGGWLGMLGGGAPARLFTSAAQRLGYRVAVLDAAERSPAASLADRHVRAHFGDESACAELATLCAGVAAEGGNVPVQTLRWIGERCRVIPGAAVVSATRDAAQREALVRGCAVPLRQTDGPMELEREICVIAARDAAGNIACYPVAEIVRRDGRLAYTIAPARVSRDIASRATDVARTVAERLGQPGLLTIGFGVLPKGELVVSEIAPWACECGHYTIDACEASQYEQQARILSGQPLGATSQIGPTVAVNLAADARGAGAPDWNAVLGRTGAKLHLYGETEARPGCSLGHCTVLAGHIETAIESARTILRAMTQ
ncbi:MAG: ATP-grasp domain-containing protein [Betaproteobacteria bacterium]|jgi:5-(carboxyamino)imidazole ribonucleotide synthase|nr:ATP-grasp domain-containing protein [Betaproteobacteria bacterium]